MHIKPLKHMSKPILSAGTPAPQLSGSDQNGNSLSINDFAGKKLVVFFYPQDNTPTCTKEACNLRDNYGALKAAGYEVIGVSPDGEKSHKKFIDKFQLPFPLVSDVDHQWIEAFGVWGEKQMYGKTYMGLLRTTFLIDEQGTIARVIDNVKSADHAAQILAGEEGKT